MRAQSDAMRRERLAGRTCRCGGESPILPRAPVRDGRGALGQDAPALTRLPNRPAGGYRGARCGLAAACRVVVCVTPIPRIRPRASRGAEEHDGTEREAF